MYTVSDEDFIELVVRERMQQCYFRWSENSENKHDETDKIERAFETVISTLCEKDKNIIQQYFDSLVDNSAMETDFFYRAGVKDGFNLYRMIVERPDEK